MDHLRQQYTHQPPISISLNPRSPNPNVYAHHALDPVRYHHWAGYFPQDAHIRKLHLEMEEYPTLLFQHAPKFHYQPHTSNVDVDLH
jgi:hypothetical protein